MAGREVEKRVDAGKKLPRYFFDLAESLSGHKRSIISGSNDHIFEEFKKSIKLICWSKFETLDWALEEHKNKSTYL